MAQVVVVGVVVVDLVVVAAAAVASAVARQRHGGGLVACATWLRPHDPLRRRAAKHRDERPTVVWPNSLWLICGLAPCPLGFVTLP